MGIDLPTAERKAAELLERTRVIDTTLSTLPPADPRRAALIAEKAAILPRYRGAKQHVKELRRAANSTSPKAALAVAFGEVDAASTATIDRKVLQAVYVAIAEARDRDHDTHAVFTDTERVAVDAFLDAMDEVDDG